MKKQFGKVELNIYTFDSNDVIATSCGCKCGPACTFDQCSRSDYSCGCGECKYEINKPVAPAVDNSWGSQ